MVWAELKEENPSINYRVEKTEEWDEVEEEFIKNEIIDPDGDRVTSLAELNDEWYGYDFNKIADVIEKFI